MHYLVLVREISVVDHRHPGPEVDQSWKAALAADAQGKLLSQGR